MQTATTCHQRFMVTAPVGIHLRPAAMMAKTLGRFESEVTVSCNRSVANGKSPLSIIMLEASYGTEVLVDAVGPDAEDAMAAVANLFLIGFGEAEGHTDRRRRVERYQRYPGKRTLEHK